MKPTSNKKAMKHIFCGLLFFMSSVVFSQNKGVLSNSEYLILQDKVRALSNSKADSALLFAERIEKSNSYLHKAFGIGAKSYLYQIKGDSIKSKRFYKLAFENLNKMSASEEKTKLNAYLLNYGGLSEWKRGNLSKALEKYQEGKKLSKKVGDFIQIIKFNNNISSIYSDVGNYKQAINLGKESDRFSDKIEYLYNHEQFIRSKSNINFNLGGFYEKYYCKDTTKVFMLDSAAFYYKKAISFSRNLEVVKINSELSLGNVYLLKNDFKRAEKIYHQLLIDTKNNNRINEYFLVNRNLGQLYYTIKNYNKALFYFKKVDSIYAGTGYNLSEYIYSNYYQAKIYVFFKDYEKAISHSKIYLENFEKNESKLSNEAFNVNYNLSKNDLKKEMTNLQNEYKNKNLLRLVVIGFFTIAFIVLVLSLIKNRRDKKKIDEKLNSLIVEYKENLKNSTVTAKVLDESTESLVDSPKKEIVFISIDEEKENEIIEKLIKLEKKLQYLNPDFTQQIVAKKIKTNTTYLSYVVNKRFGKSFSEYSNELKINYVINEMITNPTYRKYSTQAIAESVGFKNAVSFTKSFNKRTGVTPVQFVKRLEIKTTKELLV